MAERRKLNFMKMNPFKWFAILSAKRRSSASQAYEFRAGDVCYNITSTEDRTLEVTYFSPNASYNKRFYSGSVAIPPSVRHEGKEYTVTRVGSYAFHNCTSLTRVRISESVVAIGGSTFYNCSSLTQVAIPGSVEKVGGSAFWSCKGLTQVTIPESLAAIGDYTFFGCIGLEEVVVPDSVTAIGTQAFCNCKGLRLVSIGRGVAKVGSYAFHDCTALESITFRNPEPPSCHRSTNVFGNVDKEVCVLRIPAGAREAYSEAYEWKDFPHIEEMPAPTHSVV